MHISLDHPELRNEGHVGPDRREEFARLVTHYWSNDAFMPGTMRSSLGWVAFNTSPDHPCAWPKGHQRSAVTAWQLHRGLSQSALTIVEGEGHGGPRQSAELTHALDRIAIQACVEG